MKTLTLWLSLISLFSACHNLTEQLDNLGLNLSSLQPMWTASGEKDLHEKYSDSLVENLTILTLCSQTISASTR
jgi:hypothetical protein